MIDAIVGMTGASVIGTTASSDPAMFMSKYLVLDASTKYAGANVTTASAGKGFAGIDAPQRSLWRLDEVQLLWRSEGRQSCGRHTKAGLFCRPCQPESSLALASGVVL